MMRYGLALICLALFVVFFLPAPAVANACARAPAPPTVEVVTNIKPVKFDLTRPIADLNQIPLHSPSPRSDEYHSDIGGVMSGKVSVTHKMQFMSSIDEKTERGCITVTGVIVTIELDPKILIASDLRKQICIFKEVFAHEARHVEVDRALIEKYQTRFGDGIAMVLAAPADYQSGELSEAELAASRNQIQENVEYALGALYTAMMDEREALQRNVDTISEYRRMGQLAKAQSETFPCL